MRMKKLIIGSVIMGLVLSLGLASAFAVERKSAPQKVLVKTGALKGADKGAVGYQRGDTTNIDPSIHSSHFVDKDGDGVCDNQLHDGTDTHGSHFTDEDADGVCDNRLNDGMHHGNRGHRAGRDHQ